MGRYHYATWYSRGEDALSGTASVPVDATWAAGALNLISIDVYSAGAYVNYRPGAPAYKSPSGLKDPRPVDLDFAGAQSAIATWIIVPSEVIFTDRDGTSEDTYTVPALKGVDYLVGDNVVPAGTYPGTGDVSVTARGKADYAFEPGAVSEWRTTFTATPYEVAPAAVVFTDKEGTAEDSYIVPETEGVDYLVGDNVVPAGTYPGTGTVTVTARAKADYVLKAGAVSEWSATFKATRFLVAPAAVVFTDKEGTAEDAYTVPETDGVDYLVGDKVVPAGTYPGTGTVTVTARAKADYVLKAGAVSEWSATFKATPYLVTPAAVVFTDKDGTAEDSYTVPALAGVEYFVNDKAIPAGTYPGAGKVTVTANAKPDFVLTEGSAASWSATFKATPFLVTPAAVVFTDKDGTAEDSYTVPATDGVEYFTGDKVVPAGTYPGAGIVTVTANAKDDYVLKAGAVSEWSATFRATPLLVTPAPVVFTDKDGTADDSYTVPATEGVDYLVGDKVVPAGAYPGTGTVTVTAKTKPNYALVVGALASWTATFKASPLLVTPAAVVFTDKDGTAEDTYTVPAMAGVEYFVNDKAIPAGTYPGAGTVTVKATAKPDYVLTEGPAASWSATFRASPLLVTPAAVVFTDKDGTAEDTYMVPATEGVDYLLADKVVPAGTYPGTGEVTVTARAKPDYVLTEGAASWTAAFKATPLLVTPAPVVFTDKDGTAEDSYAVPETVGVDYLVSDKVVPAGTYPGTGEVTVTARAKPDYVLTEGAASWTATFKATPLLVTPAAVVFTEKDGTAADTYAVPATEGVDYLVGDKLVPAGTYPGTGTVTVTARPKPDYALADGAAATWTATFKATPYVVTPAAVTFADKDGTAQDRYTVPSTQGVDYLVGGKMVAPGSYLGAGTVTVTAKAKPDYVLKASTVSSWSLTFKGTFRFTSVVGTGDLNGDRKADVLVRDSSGALWLYPGNGRGGWLTRIKAGTGWNGFTSIVGPGDLNSDGKADILARDTAGALWLYPGNGRGGWLARIKAGTGWNGFTAIVGPGDMNGDGKADVLARDTSGTLWLYPGNGRGGWLARIKAGTGWNGFTAVVGAGDMNGDRKSDVLARDSGGTLWLYRGNGRGGFLSRTSAGPGWNAMTFIVSAREFNGDGRNDVLAVDSAGVLWLYRGNGTGGWLGRVQAATGWN
ncbi:hypothetical protein SRABI83_02404 [Arthrobacter sp. Bi83]|uniref:FG-GAP-like repeat-containing protein n=1 Tax=Arthrobacter sp. Bi83 TaxID=2822353 RepID=UPI001D31890B|nr:FG-GAP-like repeat-containing protein [Arthrobacter sp. Bi83]CAH0222097.1 hypothetical protein SRABI83_02404 [Arthrobacter sp. Bi83]